MVDGRLLGAGGHSQRPQEAVDQDGELQHVLGLGLHHVEDNLVPLPHALGVRRGDVVLHDDLPLPPAQPATHEALHLGDNTHTHTHIYIHSRLNTYTYMYLHTHTCTHTKTYTNTRTMATAFRPKPLRPCAIWKPL